MQASIEPIIPTVNKTSDDKKIKVININYAGKISQKPKLTVNWSNDFRSVSNPKSSKSHRNNAARKLCPEMIGIYTIN